MSDTTQRKTCPVIAIGASAGGLEACRALLPTVAADSPAAFILILHLDPTHDSLVVDLLAKDTDLRVVQAGDGMALKAGVLHVIPPGMFLTVEGGVIRLAPPEGGKAVRLPLDALLQSLARGVGAQGAGTQVACVILSGTGADGSLGLVDLQGAGGLVIVQDPSDAGFPGMPDSAIATGCVSQVLPADQIGAVLNAFCDRATQQDDQPAPSLQAETDTAPSLEHPPQGDPFDSVFALLADHAAQDLTLYKRGTLERRVTRRMSLAGLKPNDVSGYLDRLRADSDERDLLTNDLLIHVTGFFRDTAVFDHLARHTATDLVRDSQPEKPLRIWVAGCSTGEEAYSLAIVFAEAMEAARPGGRIQILASDIDAESITGRGRGSIRPRLRKPSAPPVWRGSSLQKMADTGSPRTCAM